MSQHPRSEGDSFAPEEHSGADCPSVSLLPGSSMALSDKDEFAGGYRADEPLTDEGRERAIVTSGLEMQRAMREWEHTGCFAARGRADFWRVCMERDIHARSHEQVARLEQERGLA